MYDSRITTKARSTDHIKFVCQNHPTLFWFGKNIPGRSIFFDGEDTTVVPFVNSWKGAHPLGGPGPVQFLQHRLNGTNLFTGEPNPAYHVTEWADVLELVEHLTAQANEYAFECACPMRDLIVWPGYETMPEVAP